MYVAKDWGAEKNAWLVSLSWTIATVAAVLLALGLLFLFRVPLLQLVAKPLRALHPFWRLLAILVAKTPGRYYFRRYLYVGRHLATA